MSKRLLTAAVVVAALCAAGPARAAPISSHAMVYACCTPPPLEERFFAEAEASGARYIRVDIGLGAIFPRAGEPPDWSSLDRVADMSRRHHLAVLGLILDTPPWLAACPPGETERNRCPPRDAGEFARLVGRLAEHARGRIDHWEIGNEPDANWAFKGGPEDYARMLRASYDAIKARVPDAQVVSGGVERPDRPEWIRRTFATPGADAAHAFDISGVHLRVRAHGQVADLPKQLLRWQELLAGYGFRGPVWVTEHGYPADPAFQYDPAFRGGDPAQAAYLRESIPLMAEAGADQIFVTLRDNDWGEYLSEGIAHIDETQPGYPVVRRQSFEAVRSLATSWDAVMALRADRRDHARMAARLDRLAQEARDPIAAALQEGAARGHLLVVQQLTRELSS